MKTILLASHCPFVLSGISTVVTTVKNLVSVCSRLPDEHLQLTMKAESVDVLVLDVSPHDINDYQHLIEGRREAKPRVIIVTSHINDSWITSLTKPGVYGIIDRRTSSFKEMEDAIRSVLLGNTYFSDSIERKIKDADRKQIVQRNFSEKQKKIVYLISQGLKTKEIANIFNKSSRTIDNSRAYLLRVTRCKNSAELVNFFNQNNLLIESSELPLPVMSHLSSGTCHDKPFEPCVKKAVLVSDRCPDSSMRSDSDANAFLPDSTEEPVQTASLLI